MHELYDEARTPHKQIAREERAYRGKAGEVGSRILCTEPVHALEVNQRQLAEVADRARAPHTTTQTHTKGKGGSSFAN